MSQTAVDSARPPASQPAATVAACLIADGGAFVSRPVDTLTLDFAGIVGDFHAGLTRPSTSREPWYPRGTIVRNDRQITIVSAVGWRKLPPRWASRRSPRRGLAPTLC